LQKDYDKLWTEERMRRVVEAASKNQVAIEHQRPVPAPGAAFVKMAKSAGCKFTLGTNNAGPGDLRRSEYGLRMIEECKLGWQDFFVPGAWWPRAVERRAICSKPG
jgi:histidinol phosphatase-like PHP family hydrolase